MQKNIYIHPEVDIKVVFRCLFPKKKTKSKKTLSEKKCSKNKMWEKADFFCQKKKKKTKKRTGDEQVFFLLGTRAWFLLVHQ